MIFLGGGEMVVVVKPLTVSFFKTFSILSMCVLKYLVFYKKKKKKKKFLLNLIILLQGYMDTTLKLLKALI